jgi:hypothetical protein
MGEVMVLLLRVCLPVHLICSILQGANLSKIIMGQAPDMSLFSLLLPAIALHGSFDFFLFVMAVVSFVNEEEGFWFQFLTFSLALVIAGVGASIARRNFKNVQNDYDRGWHQLNDDTGHSEIMMTSIKDDNYDDTYA